MIEPTRFAKAGACLNELEVKNRFTAAYLNNKTLSILAIGGIVIGGVGIGVIIASMGHFPALLAFMAPLSPVKVMIVGSSLVVAGSSLAISHGAMPILKKFETNRVERLASQGFRISENIEIHGRSVVFENEDNKAITPHFFNDPKKGYAFFVNDSKNSSLDEQFLAAYGTIDTTQWKTGSQIEQGFIEFFNQEHIKNLFKDSIFFFAQVFSYFDREGCQKYKAITYNNLPEEVNSSDQVLFLEKRKVNQPTTEVVNRPATQRVLNGPRVMEMEKGDQIIMGYGLNGVNNAEQPRAVIEIIEANTEPGQLLNKFEAEAEKQFNRQFSRTTDTTFIKHDYGLLVLKV